MPGSVNTADEYEFINYEEVAASPEDVAKVRDWLQPTDYLADSGEFRRHLLSQAPGTGLWICETDAYRKWHDSPDHGSLWINGVPGAGKSVTASSIIQHLKTTEDCPVLFFFFRNIVAANFSPRGLLQDWLAQLLPYSPRLQVALRARVDTSLEDISDSNLMELFNDGISCVPRLYCVVDALDEMTADNRAFLENLNRLATYRPRSLKLLMTSRPKQYLQSALRDSSIVHVSLQKKLVDHDILLYLNHRFDGVLGGQHLERAKIIDMVASRSEGLFLYAKLAMDQVEAALTSSHAIGVEELEKTLPAGLEDTYDKMLRRQREEHGVSVDTQVLVLQAVTHASRPLRLNELASLIECLAPDSASPKAYKALVAKSCGPLVEILEDETLQVVHHSFTEFLRGDTRNASVGELSTRFPIIDSPTAHKKMAMNCLRYLQSGSLENEGESDVSITYRKPAFPYGPGERDIGRFPFDIIRDGDPFKYQEARLLHPFLQYAVTNWNGHASRYDADDEDFFAAVLDFLRPESVAFRRWLKLQWGATSRSQGSTDGLPTALHLAAYSGLSKFSLRIIEDGASVSSLDAHDRTALHWAAVNGHEEVVSLLIKKGCDPNAEDAYGLKPIHLAARRNRAAVVTVLLESGVEPDTVKTKENHPGPMGGGETITRGECAIFMATKGGHVETVIAMIPFCKGKVLERLLCESCQHGLTDAVLAILQTTDVSVNAVYRKATALYFACRATSVKCVEALIKRGADVSMTSTFKPKRRRLAGVLTREKETAPLHCLVTSWTDQNDKDCRAILRLLLNAGADLEQVSGAGNTPLLIAAGSSETQYQSPIRSSALKALLEVGADISKESKESRGASLLHLVLDRTRDPTLVRLLIEHGIDPNATDARGTSILQCCVYQPGMVTGAEHTLTIVKYLLDKGADPNMSDDSGFIKRRCWFHLPSVYTTERFTELMELLLEDGIDINIQSKEGRTLYLLCLRDEERLQSIREHGAKTDVVDSYGNNALHILAKSGSILREQMERRIADGVDPLSTNKDGYTLMHHIIPSYDTAEEWATHVRWLIGLGICVNAVDTSGGTILHHYLTRCSRGATVREKNRFHFIDAINFENKVNFEVRDNDGFAPIHIAATKTEIELAKLVSSGADPTFLTQGGQNILHLASCARMPGIVGQILDQFGTDGLEQEDNLGRTPLHYACSSGEAESVAFLLQHGANVHATDSDRRTPLHACANFKEERALWDAGGKYYQSLVATREDRFRPGASRKKQPGLGVWYNVRYGGPPRQRMRRTYFPDVTSITQMLLDAGADVAAVRGDCTALDEALDSGCWEFVEPFFLDEDLFMRATKRLESDSAYSKTVEEIRQRMRAQMALMQPRSCLGGNAPLMSEVSQHPELYLGLLSRKDIAHIVNEAVDADITATSNYDTLKDLIKLGDLRVLETVSRLVVHYSSYDTVRDSLEKGRKESEYKYKYSTEELTPLQIACDQPKPNMLTVRFLVEKLHVDVNAPKAILEDRYRSNAKISSGGTALHMLASANEWWKLEAMRCLLANGADANVVDEKGQTPLHIAARGMQYGDRDTSISGFWRLNAVRILLDHGANPDLLDKQGETALHRACSAPDVMAELLRRGADATLGTRSPLFQAIHDQNLAAAKT
uniref:NACHT domain-containing protein n=1 Tax=Bionectria ochroleuca TaxID=29856 RepID=A0A0B7KAB4_BIOOC